MLLNRSASGNENFKWCREICALVAFDTTSNKYSRSENATFSMLSLVTNLSSKYAYTSALANDLNLVTEFDTKMTERDGAFEIQLDVNSDKVLTEVAVMARCYDSDSKRNAQ